MPIISQIGQKSLKVRLLYAVIYVVLILGSLTMIYPMLLMLSGSVKSEADSWSIKPYPEFWFNDLILFQKYAESKYNNDTLIAQLSWCKPVMSWRSIEKPPSVDSGLICDFRAWRKTISPDRYFVGQTLARGMLPKNLRSYRNYMAKKFKNDLQAYNIVASQAATSWSTVRFPTDILGRYLNANISSEFRDELTKWADNIPKTDLRIIGANGEYALNYLYGVYTSRIENYNQTHGTNYKEYGEILLPNQVPKTDGLFRHDWERFVRNDVMLYNLKLDLSLRDSFQNFLKSQYESIEIFNKEHRTNLTDISAVPFPEKINDVPYLRRNFEMFIKSSKHCPIEAITIYSFDEMFKEFLLNKNGKLPENYPGLGSICAACDWADCMENKSAIKWEFTMRNHWQVLDYIAMHGNGLANTFIYCSLAIITALIVNPLAAYALSRFNLPGTYKILLFCMATMAFPGEVTMIPNFLLLKKFPLFPITGGLLVTILSFLLLERIIPKVKENIRSITSLLAGLIAGGLIIPNLGTDFRSINLLNNFAALILPGMANGYSIFLLKGFFDSMPRELYEAADIDGASEWTKFWMLTMNLSKPILAVIALGAFTASYSAFMMALIIIPDQKMWTIMVWIFQLQSQTNPAVVYASLVIAAIPTFIIFALCQNIIIKGIVVPTEK